MGLAGGHRPHPRAIIFDLDRCLIDSRNAWRYCIEESIAAATGRSVSAIQLVEEYHIRPWRDALAVLASSREEATRCESLCDAMFERSAMKKLLVHEGMGMALDALRGERIELAAVSRRPHPLALKQVQSTGLDRFLAALSATPPGERWDIDSRTADCLAFLEVGARDSAYIGAETRDLAVASEAGLVPFAAGWAPAANETREAIALPSHMSEVMLRTWATRR